MRAQIYTYIHVLFALGGREREKSTAGGKWACVYCQELSTLIFPLYFSLSFSASLPVYLYMKILNELRDAESLFLPHKTENFPLFSKLFLLLMWTQMEIIIFLHDNVQSYDNSIVLVGTCIAHISFMYSSIKDHSTLIIQCHIFAIFTLPTTSHYLTFYPKIMSETLKRHDP